jgi:hypothetical protein
MIAEENDQEASVNDIFTIVYIDMLQCLLVVKVKYITNDVSYKSSS